MNDTHQTDWVVTTGPRRQLRRNLCQVGILAGMGNLTITPQAEGEAASRHLALALSRRPFDEANAASIGVRLIGMLEPKDREAATDRIAQLVAGAGAAAEQEAA